jgi:hypothetical protein
MKKSKTIKPITFKDLDLNAILSKVEEKCIEIKKDSLYTFKHEENYQDLINAVTLPFHTEVLSISLLNRNLKGNEEAASQARFNNNLIWNLVCDILVNFLETTTYQSREFDKYHIVFCDKDNNLIRLHRTGNIHNTQITITIIINLK